MEHALKESGLEPGNLVIELTESAIMHNTEANLARLLQLKALGVRLAIDDFGTGYSSLVLPAPLSDRHPEDRPIVRRPPHQQRTTGRSSRAR